MKQLLVPVLAFALLGGICAAAAPPMAVAQEKTPANAFAFIRDNVADGSWMGNYVACRGNDDCWDAEGRIIGADFQNGSYCNLRFVIQTETGSATRHIDLTKAFSIWFDGYTRKIHFAGPVRNGEGEVLSGWDMHASYDISERVLAALHHLQTVCKPAGPW
jgi:hypothetical protein